MSPLLAFGLYLVFDVTLSLIVGFIAYKRLPLIRETLKRFLAVPGPCEHFCKERVYNELMGYEDEHHG